MVLLKKNEKIDERNEIFVVKSVKSMIKNPSKKSQITIF